MPDKTAFEKNKKTTRKRKTTVEAPAKPAPAAGPVTQSLQSESPAAAAAKIQELIEQLRRGDLATRSAAAKKLAQLGDRQATSALTEALRDPTAEVAREAAGALGLLNDSASLHALIDVVMNRDGYFHSLVRTAAAESLGQMKNQSAVDALVAAIRDPICETSIAAIRALGKLGAAGAATALQAVAKNADGYFLPQTQQAAVEVLVIISA